MAKTVLDAVNDILIKAAAIDSGSSLSSLTDTSRQTYVDLALQVFNETVDEAYSRGRYSKPRSLKEGTITLVSGQKTYAIKGDVLELRRDYDLISEANNHIIEILGEDGYYQVIRGDLDQDDTGLPAYCAMSPIDGRLVMDRAPTSVEAGRIYKYRYEREITFDEATDLVPFENTPYRAFVAASAEMWKKERHLEFSEALYLHHLGRGIRYLGRISPKRSWMSASSASNSTDPMQR